jgi:5-methylcytosine-specific restriction endonuclease McrA
MRAWLDIIKLERGCAKCGYRENVFALQWDHIIPVQSGKNWGGPASMAAAKRLVIDPNIQVLCANCHCIKTRLGEEHLPLSRRST